MSSSEQAVDTSESHVIDGSHDTNDGSRDTEKLHNSSNAVTIEMNDITVVEDNLRQFDVDGSTSDDDSGTDERSHDPDRSTILNTIYQKYVKDRKLLTATQKMHKSRNKKV